MNARRVTLALFISGILMAMGCGVPQSKYDTTANKLKRAESDLTAAQDAHNKTKQALTTKELRLKGIRSHMQSVQQKSNALRTRLASLRERLKACKAPPAAPSRPAPPPPPSAGAGSAKGGLDMAAVKAGVSKILGRIQKCYVKYIVKKNEVKITATLIVTFRINKRGKPRRVKVRQGGKQFRKVRKCARRAFRKARFPRSKKNTKVTYPVSLAP